MVFKNALFACGMILLAATGTAHADVYTVNVYTGDVGHAFSAVTDSAALFTSATHAQHAEFTYTGPLDFINNAAQNSTSSGDLNATFFGADVAGISNYAVITAATGVDYGSFATLSSFLAASGSVAGYAYGSFYEITDMTISTKGTNLTITHDDGAGVYSGGVLLPGTTTGPTSAITETITLPATAGYTIAYGRENGTPSVLTVAVPEPMSLTLLGASLFGLGMVRRRRA